MKALPASAKFLRKLRDDFGNLGLAAAAYNAGPGRIQKWLAKESELPRETRDYVRIITGTKAEDWTERTDSLSRSGSTCRAKRPCEGIGQPVQDEGRRLGSGQPDAFGRHHHSQGRTTGGAADGQPRAQAVRVLDPEEATAHGKARSMIAARAAGKSAKARAIRLASSERSDRSTPP